MGNLIFKTVQLLGRVAGTYYEYEQPGIAGYSYTDPESSQTFHVNIEWDASLAADHRSAQMISSVNMALNTLGESGRFYEIASNPNLGGFPSDVDVQLTAFGSSSYSDGTYFGFQVQNPTITLSTSAPAKEYKSENGEWVQFTYEYSLTHELTHHITGLDDRESNGLHNQLTNAIYTDAFQNAVPRLDYDSVRWSSNLDPIDFLSEANSAFGKGNDLSPFPAIFVNSRRGAISVVSVYQDHDAPSINFVRNTSAGV